MSSCNDLKSTTLKKFECEEVSLYSVPSKVYYLLSPKTRRPPLLMKVIQNNLAASSLSPIVQYTMNTLPPKIMLAQQANLRRETSQA